MPLPATSRTVGGPFAMYESLPEQMKRISVLRKTSPAYAQALLEQGMMLAKLAEEGRTEDLVKMTMHARQGEMLFWFTTKMFKAAAINGHVDVLRYMLDNGVEPTFPGLADTLHGVVECTRSGLGEGPAFAGPIDQAAATRVLAVCLDAGFDVNEQRKGDYLAPLHIACSRGLLDLARSLLSAGADCNAVGTGDATPMRCALEHQRSVTDTSGDTLATDGDGASVASKVADALVAHLASLGAKEGWRRAPSGDGGGASGAAAGAGAGAGGGVTREADGGVTFSFE